MTISNETPDNLSSSMLASELAERLRSGDKQTLQVIDVRTPAEFRSAHLECATNIPLDKLSSIDANRFEKNLPLAVVCQSGVRSGRARDQLISMGWTKVVSIEGGMSALSHTDLAIAVGRNVISLERQVRIAAGSLVLLGTLLSLFAHPYLIGIAIFVGAGLVFAGVTNTCGMAMLIARMPWNR